MGENIVMFYLTQHKLCQLFNHILHIKLIITLAKKPCIIVPCFNAQNPKFSVAQNLFDMITCHADILYILKARLYFSNNGQYFDVMLTVPQNINLVIQ